MNNKNELVDEIVKRIEAAKEQGVEAIEDEKLYDMVSTSVLSQQLINQLNIINKLNFSNRFVYGGISVVSGLLFVIIALFCVSIAGNWFQFLGLITFSIILFMFSVAIFVGLIKGLVKGDLLND